MRLWVHFDGSLVKHKSEIYLFHPKEKIAFQLKSILIVRVESQNSLTNHHTIVSAAYFQVQKSHGYPVRKGRFII
jgi:hypothetical protein